MFENSKIKIIIKFVVLIIDFKYYNGGNTL